MKKMFVLMTAIVAFITFDVNAKGITVPAAVKSALTKKYPVAASAKVTWEKEKGNYEANWGGKSGEDMSVQFTPDGTFIEQVQAIAITELPATVTAYVKEHYKGLQIKEAGKVTDAKGATIWEAEVKGKDLVFDKDGKFLKID